MITSLLTHVRLWGRAHNPSGFCIVTENERASPLRNILYCSQRKPDLFLIRFAPTSAVMG
jgi:hypothetical protein